MNKKALFIIILSIFSLVLGCASSNLKTKREDTLFAYQKIIRWGQWTAAADFLDPEYLKQNPISELDMRRLMLFRVEQYLPYGVQLSDEGMTARQTVQIRLYNTRTAVAHSIVDQQEWRYNEEHKVWRLHSGLPDPTQKSR